MFSLYKEYTGGYTPLPTTTDTEHTDNTTHTNTTNTPTATNTTNSNTFAYHFESYMGSPWLYFIRKLFRLAAALPPIGIYTYILLVYVCIYNHVSYIYIYMLCIMTVFLYVAHVTCADSTFLHILDIVYIYICVVGAACMSDLGKITDYTGRCRVYIVYMYV